MNDRIPADFQYSTTDLAIVAMLAMPLLPTPIATREAGFSLAANGDSESCVRTSAGMSRIARSGKFWLTKRSRENCIAGSITNLGLNNSYLSQTVAQQQLAAVSRGVLRPHVLTHTMPEVAVAQAHTARRRDEVDVGH